MTQTEYDLLSQAYDRFTDNDFQPANSGLQEWLKRTEKVLADYRSGENNSSRPTKRALDGARFCPACHALLEEGSVYCDTCGTDTPRQ